MNPVQMITPAFGMLLLTFGCMLFTLGTRIRAVRSRQVSMKYFTLFEKGEQQIPFKLIQTGRHYVNLFEVPVLFYFLISLIFSAQLVDQNLLMTCWGYVFFRTCHSFVHLSYNNVNHRLLAFLFSNICLVFSWLRFAWLMFG